MYKLDKSVDSMVNHIRHIRLPDQVSTKQVGCLMWTTVPVLHPLNEQDRAWFRDWMPPSRQDRLDAFAEEHPGHVDNHRDEWATPLKLHRRESHALESNAKEQCEEGARRLASMYVGPNE